MANQSVEEVAAMWKPWSMDDAHGPVLGVCKVPDVERASGVVECAGSVVGHRLMLLGALAEVVEPAIAGECACE